MLIYSMEPRSDWKLILKLNDAEDIRTLNHSTHGWSDLIVQVSLPGAKVVEKEFRFKRDHYRPVSCVLFQSVDPETLKTLKDPLRTPCNPGDY